VCHDCSTRQGFRSVGRPEVPLPAVTKLEADPPTWRRASTPKTPCEVKRVALSSSAPIHLGRRDKARFFSPISNRAIGQVTFARMLHAGTFAPPMKRDEKRLRLTTAASGASGNPAQPQRPHARSGLAPNARSPSARAVCALAMRGWRPSGWKATDTGKIQQRALVERIVTSESRC
jgi:hypothetical protein